MGIEEAIIQELKAQTMREGRNTGIQKGLEKGREEGREEGKWQKKTRLFVFRADRKGMSVADIAELVDLPSIEVEALIREVRLNPPEEH
jgi:predicted transposase YdaD